MLTRLEVDGFKNLRDVIIEFGPFTCIAGENGAGKSNVFDAIEFLSLLASHSLMEAAQRIRSTGDDRSGDPRDLFWRGSTQSAARTGNVSESVGTGRLMRLAAEMIVPKQVEDDFGRQAKEGSGGGESGRDDAKGDVPGDGVVVAVAVQHRYVESDGDRCNQGVHLRAHRLALPADASVDPGGIEPVESRGEPLDMLCDQQPLQGRDRVAAGAGHDLQQDRVDHDDLPPGYRPAQAPGLG